jgi:hypothetical protein
MVKKRFLIPFLLLFCMVLLWTAMPVTAENQPQQITSPTPDASGRIVYIVQANDTCLSIALRFLNGDVNRIIELNNLDADCVIVEGQQLLLNIVEVSTPTVGPTPTATSNLPTATPTPGTGEICVMLFDDLNGNGRKDPDELPIAGGAISISDREGITSLTGLTVIDGDPTTSDELEPLCFENLPEGEYNVSLGPPEGYNPTTVMNYPLTLTAGDSSILDFGAQTSSAGALVAEQESPTLPESRRSPLLGIVGGVLVLFGIGLGVYLRVLRR